MPKGRDPSIARNKILQTGFRLYTEKNIDSVSYQQISYASGVPMPTICRHFPRKQDLVIAIGTEMWGAYWKQVEAERPMETVPGFSAVQRIEFLLDRIIVLYRTKPEVLRFNLNFDSYVQAEQLTDAQLQAYFDAIQPVKDRFDLLYVRALEDHTVRTDLSKEQLFYATFYTMLSAAGRYACGTIWPRKSGEDCQEALETLKNMIMSYCTEEK